MMNKGLFFTLVVLGLSSQAMAVPSKLTLSGRITKPDGTDLKSSNVDFKFSVLDSNATCVLYVEDATSLDLSNSSGSFEYALGTATATFSSGSLTLPDIFNNSATSYACQTSGTYTPSSTDDRKLIIQFIDQTESTPTWRTFSSPIPLNSVPSAFYANSAAKLGTNVASDFVIKTGIPTCSAGQFLTWDGTNLTCATAGTGSGTVTSVSGTAPIAVATGTTTPVISIAKADASTNGYLASTDWATFNGKQAAGNYITALSGDVTAAGPGSVPASVAKLQGQTLTLTTPAAGEFIRYNGSAFVNSALVAGDIPNLSWTKITSGTPTTLAGYGITDALSSSAGTDVNTASTLVKRDASGKFNTTTIALSNLILNDSGSNTATLQAPPSVSTSYSLKLPTAQGGANQALTNDGSGNLSWTTMTAATTVAANAPLSVSGGTSSPTVSIQQASTTQDGYLSSADFNTFNNKQSTALSSGKILVGNGSGFAMPVYPTGDVVMTNAGAYTVKKIYGTAVSATAPTLAGQVLRYDGTATYIPSVLGIADIKATITPFGGVFANSSCTASQSLYYNSPTDTFLCQTIAITDSQITYASQTQKTFFAAPSAAAGAPTFRTIASADINSFAFVNGGNSFAAAAVLGTGDNNSLSFKTNGTVSMTLDPAGRLGVGPGVSAPRSALDVNGTILSSPASSNATATIDFLNGNMQYTNLSCQGFALYNLKDGGSYMFVVKGATSSTCSFTAYSDAGGTALTVHLPPDHAQTIASKHTIYNIAVLGTDVYLSWTPGY